MRTKLAGATKFSAPATWPHLEIVNGERMFVSLAANFAAKT